ncbi:MAG: hypothetical protein M0R38_12815 [Bacteroidia bacterium]|nr:hypothetical protein [Bacteroidia bacterium]
MFIKTKDYEKCIQKVKIEVGTFVGLEKDEDVFITLKELPTIQMLQLKEASEKGENETLIFLKELLPFILVDHNFFEDESTKVKMKNEEVANLLFESLNLTAKVVNEYTQASFFSQAQNTGSK